MATQADRVWITTRHQRRARRRAKRGRVEVVVTQAVVGKRVDIRCTDQPTKALDLGKPDVIEQEDDDIG